MISSVLWRVDNKVVIVTSAGEQSDSAGIVAWHRVDQVVCLRDVLTIGTEP